MTSSMFSHGGADRSHEGGADLDRPGARLYARLLAALLNDDRQAVQDLRASWQAVHDYVAYHRPEGPGDEVEESLPDEKRAELILWVSTPPSTETEWEALHGVPGLEHVYDERRRQIEHAKHLWHTWSHPKETLVRLSKVFEAKRFEARTAWISNAEAFFDRPVPEGARRGPRSDADRRDEQFRLDVLAGYAAFVEQSVLSDGSDLLETRVALLGSESPPVLRIRGNDRRLTVEQLARGIAFRSGTDLEGAAWLAEAVTLSLPAYPDVLPTFGVDVNGHKCWLASNRDDPLAD